MTAIPMLYGIMVFAAFVVFAVTLAVVSEQTERYLKTHDRSTRSE